MLVAPGRRAVVALLAAAAAIPALIPALIGAIPAQRDLLVFWLPLKIYLGRRLATGDLPLWDPFTENGTPFMANLQSQVFYLPNLLTSPLPLAWAYGLFWAFHLAAAAIGMFVWARAYRIDRPGAAVAALAYSLGGPVISTLEFSSIITVAAWIPWSCWAALQLSRRPGPRTLLIYMATIGALGLSGAPHIALVAVAVALAFGVAASGSSPRAAAGPAGLRASGLRLAGAGLLAGGLIAFQLLPFAELVAHSDRRAGFTLELSAMHSVQAGDLLGLLSPEADAYDTTGGSPRGQGFLRLQYQGALALLAAAAAFTGRLARRRRLSPETVPILVAAGVTVLCWLLAAGDTLPFFPFLHRGGLLAGLRYPAKFILPASAAIALLAGFGLERLARNARTAAAGFVALTIAIAALGVATGDTGYLHGAAASLAAAAVLALRPYRALLATVLGVDLLLAHALVHPILPADQLLADFAAARTVRASSSRVYSRPYTQADMAREARLLSQGDLFSASRLRVLRLMGNLPMALGVRSARGGPALRLRSQAEYLQATDRGPAGLPALRGGAAEYFLSLDALQSTDLTAASSTDELPFLYRIQGALPRHYVSCSWRPSADPAAERSLPEVASGEIVVLESAAAALLPGRAAVAAVAPAGQVRVLHEEPDRRQFEVRAAGECLLVVVETAYPGWSASVDGKSARVLTVNGGWMAIPVSAGTSIVSLEFRPQSLMWGILISVLAVGVSGAWAWRLRRLRNGPADNAHDGE